ncbi:MAG: sulfite exporter TauE/SafE family protein [Candidatus Marinimicrobia bacterium]|nr:sulfite exporter TauE/SafE family protein [Candidatus Neomarinimicrobiota bacterium]
MELQILVWTAISIGFIHTIIGPDHYLPFIMIARARQWKITKTMWVTLLCGIGHILGSVILGVIGVVLGISIGLLENVESIRGDIASWLLIGFGIAYTVWGIRIGWRSAEHTHDHEHNEHELHQHSHHHLGRHSHLHGDPKSITPWALFIIFVLGPCEPLIPILMYPAAQGSWLDLIWVTLAFGITTITTMTLIVYIISKGLLKIELGFLEKYAHAIAGLIIALAGLSIKLLGL